MCEIAFSKSFNFLFSPQKNRQGLIKMKEVYEKNPNLGDPQSINGQLTENQSKLEKLQLEHEKYSKMLMEVVQQLGPSNGTPQSKKSHSSSISSASNLSMGSGVGNGLHHHHHHRNSLSEDSLSRSGSETSETPSGSASANGAIHRLTNGLSSLLSGGGGGVSTPATGIPAPPKMPTSPLNGMLSVNGVARDNET